MRTHLPSPLRHAVVWLEHRPWLGYYIAVLVTAEFIMHLLESHIL